MTITGSTHLYAIVGDPIRQVQTPATLNPLIEAKGIDAVVLPFHVPAEAFEPALAGIMKIRNLDGLIVTYPFKERMLGLVDAVTERAHMIGGVNTVRREADGRWIGDMFDGIGLLRAVSARRSMANSRVLLIGAGGAGPSHRVCPRRGRSDFDHRGRPERRAGRNACFECQKKPSGMRHRTGYGPCRRPRHNHQRDAGRDAA